MAIDVTRGVVEDDEVGLQHTKIDRRHMRGLGTSRVLSRMEVQDIEQTTIDVIHEESQPPLQVNSREPV